MKKINWDEVLHLSKLGKSDKEISGILKCSISSVRRIRHAIKMGKSRTPQNNPTPTHIRLRMTEKDYKSLLIKLYDEKSLSMQTIATKLGVHQRTIESHFSKYNIMRRKPWERK